MQPQVRVFCMTVFVFFLILFGSRITEKLGLDFRVSLEREGIRSRKNEIVFCCDLGFFLYLGVLLQLCCTVHSNPYTGS